MTLRFRVDKLDSGSSHRLMHLGKRIHHKTNHRSSTEEFMELVFAVIDMNFGSIPYPKPSALGLFR